MATLAGNTLGQSGEQSGEQSGLEATLLADPWSAEQFYCPTCDRSFSDRAERCPEDGTLLLRLGSDLDPMLGTCLDGRFELRKRLGRGGMGTVYLADQLSLQREVAVKIVNPEIGSDIKVTKRFGREARLASRLTHPNIVATHDLGQTDDGRLYLVMERLDGRQLASVFASECPLDQARVVELGKQLANALACAHRVGIIHRDLKPANIMVLDGAGGVEQIKVLDFGLAKVHAGTNDLPSLSTLTEGCIGTPRYMAPEVILGQDATPSSDLYALGLILYEALTGHPPFRAQAFSQLFMQHCETAPPPLPDSVDPDLAEVIYTLLEKQPSARFGGDAAAVRAALELERGFEPRKSSVGATLRPTTEVTPAGSRGAWKLAGWQLAAVVGFGLAGVLAVLRPPTTETGPSSAASAPVPVQHSEAPAQPADVSVTFSSEPAGATILVNDEPLGTTPLQRAFARSDELVQVRFELRGHLPAQASFVPNADHRVERGLEPEPERDEPPAAKPGAKPDAKPDSKPRAGGKPRDGVADQPAQKPALDFVDP